METNLTKPVTICQCFSSWWRDLLVFFQILHIYPMMLPAYCWHTMYPHTCCIVRSLYMEPNVVFFPRNLCIFLLWSCNRTVKPIYIRPCICARQMGEQTLWNNGLFRWTMMPERGKIKWQTWGKGKWVGVKHGNGVSIGMTVLGAMATWAGWRRVACQQHL